MTGPRSRRSFLRSAAAITAASTAGCLWFNESVPGGHLFVENTSTRESVVGLTVTPGTDRSGDPVVDGWYRLPVDTGFRYDEVLEAGTAYTVSVRPGEAQSADRLDVTIPTCESEDRSRTVSVRANPEGLSVIPWGCTESDYELREIEYGDPADYAVDPPADAATETPTPAE